ncbi:hypothetical protein LguiA_000971 [Lonicera macranthoides]
MKTALTILLMALVLVVGSIRAAAVQMEGRRLLTTESTLGRKAETGGTISAVGNKSADNRNNKEISYSEAEAETSDDNEKNESRHEDEVDSDGNSHHQYNSVNPPQNGANN